ncbi:A/G-specific adenine glycosylase [Chlamydiifrater volucris]|uniref:A/G-specific adenine glycosylase n=1 Tax=Chlamydiifrater volucris TaxID=2681470 RepID=UPI001BCC5584|nr:A/G-specific adenine glycosylase [Chlamydiifrater volucris]
MKKTLNSFLEEESAPERLRIWFLDNKRDLPWRKNISPYSVWISEVMLQQTRVETVVDYFNRWMKRYPSLQDVASSSEEDLIKMWEGLGYYSRVRSFKKGAEIVIKNFNGEIPSTYDELIKIPGIGPYTANAILAFAFKQRVAAVDGNVLRVFSRLFCLREPIDNPSTHREIQRLANDFLPEKNPQEVSEALIELGACVCKKTAICTSCPLQSFCKAFECGETASLPNRLARKKILSIARCVFLINCRGEYCLIKRGKGEIMRDLFEFPYIEFSDRELLSDIDRMCSLCRDLSETELTFVGLLPSLQQSFTNYKASLYPVLLKTSSYSPIFSHYGLDQIAKLPLSSGHKKIFYLLRQHLEDMPLIF